MTDLTADQILSADDLPLESVDIPEWGGTVYVRSMNGIERDQFESWLINSQGSSRLNQRGKIVSLCACDPQGVRLFTDDQSEALGKKSSTALSKIADVAMRLNAMDVADVEDIAEN